MTVVFRFVLFLFLVSVVSCGGEKVCSGLNPEIGKYNTSKKIRKGRRSVHSNPEKEAVKRHSKQVKHKKPRNGGKSVPLNHGIFGGIHIGGSAYAGGGAHIGGGNENNQQKR